MKRETIIEDYKDLKIFEDEIWKLQCKGYEVEERRIIFNPKSESPLSCFAQLVK